MTKDSIWEQLADLGGFEDALKEALKPKRHIHPPDLTPCDCTNASRFSIPLDDKKKGEQA